MAAPTAIEDDLNDLLGGKKKKKPKKKKIDIESLLAPEAQTTPQTAPEVTSEPQVPATDSAPTVAEKESAPDIAAVVTLDDFELPLRKKKRRPNIHFEDLESAIIEDDEDKEDVVVDEEEQVDTSPWAGTDRDYSYEELLERVFNIMREKNPTMVGGQKKKLVMKPPQVVRVGTKKTSFVNFTDICKFGSVDGNNQLIIKGKFQQKQIETVLRRYIKEYVTCHTCRSPDTILQKETRLFFLQCETCGSRCSVQSIKSGFQAVTAHRSALRSKQQ